MCVRERLAFKDTKRERGREGERNERERLCELHLKSDFSSAARMGVCIRGIGLRRLLALGIIIRSTQKSDTLQ